MQISEALYYKIKEKCKSLELENSELKKQIAQNTRKANNVCRSNADIISLLPLDTQKMFSYSVDEANRRLEYTNELRTIISNFGKLKAIILTILSPKVVVKHNYKSRNLDGKEPYLTFKRLEEYTTDEYKHVEKMMLDICQSIYDTQVNLKNTKETLNNDIV